jgi:glycosyltransferase involved in cell wall biosynthesis
MDTHILPKKPDLAPTRIVEIEVGQPLPDVSAFDEKTGQRYQRALCVVRLHTQPLGLVELQLDEQRVSAKEYASHIWRTLSDEMNEHLHQDGLPAVSELGVAGLPSPTTPRCIEERERFLASAPFVSVIVPTHGRTDRVQYCLRSLVTLQYPHYEIIVVDNTPSTTATAEFIQQTYGDVSQVRYLREDRAGPSWARNCGIRAARGEFLAFLDDDAVADRYWLLELVRGFRVTDDVACVTGLVLPLELETQAQLWFEELGGFSNGFTRRIYDMKQKHPKRPLYSYITEQMGTGASMAFRASFLRQIGGFDPVFGGTGAVRTGQDIVAFLQVVMHGHKLVYEPSSLAYHLHRREYAALRKQIYTYGVSTTAFLMKCVIDTPRLLFDLVLNKPFGFFRLLIVQPANSKRLTHYPDELITVQRKGRLYGPLAYLQSRWAMRHAYGNSAAQAILPQSKASSESEDSRIFEA